MATAIKRLLTFLLLSGLCFAQALPTDPFGGLSGKVGSLGSVCPNTKSWINTTTSTQILGGGQQKTISLPSVTGINTQTWLTIDAGAAPVQVTGEQVGVTSTGVETHYTYTLAHGSYIGTTMVLKEMAPGPTFVRTLATENGAGILIGASNCSGKCLNTGPSVALWDSYVSTIYAFPSSTQSAVAEYVDVTLANPLPSGHWIAADYQYTPAETFLVSAVDAVNNTVTGYFLNAHPINGNPTSTITTGLWYLGKPVINGNPTWVFCSPLGFATYQFSTQTFAIDADTSHNDFNFRHTEQQVDGSAVVGNLAPGLHVITLEAVAGIHLNGSAILSQGNKNGIQETDRVTAYDPVGKTITVTTTQAHTQGFPVRGGGVVDITANLVDLGDGRGPLSQGITCTLAANSNLCSTPVTATITPFVGDANGGGMAGVVDQTSTPGAWLDADVNEQNTNNLNPNITTAVCAILSGQTSCTDLETVKVTAHTATTLTAVFTKPHKANFHMTGYSYGSVICGLGTSLSNGCVSTQLQGGYFGSTPVWAPEELSRYLSYGLNWCGVVCDQFTYPININSTGAAKWPTPDNSNPHKVPLVFRNDAVINGQFNRNGAAQQTGCGGTGPDFAARDIEFGMANFNVPGLFIYRQPDWYDGNLYAWACGNLKLQYPNNFLNGNVNNGKETPWAILQASENDNIKWLGRCDPHNWHCLNGSQHGGLASLMTPYHVSANGGQGGSWGATSTTNYAYADNLNHTKDALRAFLVAKYGTVAALNAAWGSTYDNIGSDGVQQSISLSTADGGLTFTGNLAVLPSPLDKGSVQIFDGSGNIVAGDVPGITSSGWTGAGNFQAAVQNHYCNVSASATSLPTGCTVGITSATIDYSLVSLPGGAGHISLHFLSPQAGLTLTAKAYNGGWCNGNGVMDECGQSAHRSWTGNGTVISFDDLTTDTGMTSAMHTDMDNWLKAMVGHFAQNESTADRGVLPHTILEGPYNVGQGGVTYGFQYEAVCPYYDVMGNVPPDTATSFTLGKWLATGLQPISANGDPFGVSPYFLPDGVTKTNGFDYVNNHCGDVPWYYSKFWNANQDSGMANYTTTLTDNAVASQVLKAQAYGNQIETMSSRVGAYTGTITGVSMQPFQLLDQFSGIADVGYESLGGNPYDGNSCGTSFTIGNYTIGRVPEAGCWGNFIGSLQPYLTAAQNSLLGISVPTAAQPVFNPPTNTQFNSPTNVQITCGAGGNVFYTVDGSIPTDPITGSTISAPTPVTVLVSAATTINALCQIAGSNDSPVAQAQYTFNQGGNPAAIPTFSFNPACGGTQSVAVTLADSSPGVTIYYCTSSGCVPTTNSTVYSSPFTISQSSTINAIASGGGFTPSSVGSSTCTIQQQAYQQKAPTIKETSH